MTNSEIAAAWRIAPDVTYLNHGSFGPTPEPVLQAREEISRNLTGNPMRFFLDELEDRYAAATTDLANFVGCKSDDLLLLTNATVAMNQVARNIDLKADDEVLLTDHEYGSVFRMWRQLAQPIGAKVVTTSLPDPLTDIESIVSAIEEAITPKTRILIVSHVASATAAVLPVKQICSMAKRHGVPVAIDGPHGIGMRDLNLRDIGCDFYAASCHKWLSAPIGTGFLYVHPKHQGRFRPAIVSWGRSLSGRPKNWRDEFIWQGTDNHASLLSIPAAIRFLGDVGWDRFRQQTHALAKTARQRLESLFQTEALLPESPEWYGSMVSIPLPRIDWTPPHPATPDPWMHRLRHEFRIEVPVMHWNTHRFIRVSCHLYNTEEHLDRLITALATLRDAEV